MVRLPGLWSDFWILCCKRVVSSVVWFVIYVKTMPGPRRPTSPWIKAMFMIYDIYLNHAWIYIYIRQTCSWTQWFSSSHFYIKTKFIQILFKSNRKIFYPNSVPLWSIKITTAGLRYVTDLQKGLAILDAEYDKCHAVYTSGEGSDWKDGSLVDQPCSDKLHSRNGVGWYGCIGSLALLSVLPGLLTKPPNAWKTQPSCGSLIISGPMPFIWNHACKIIFANPIPRLFPASRAGKALAVEKKIQLQPQSWHRFTVSNVWSRSYICSIYTWNLFFQREVGKALRKERQEGRFWFWAQGSQK